MRRGRLWLGVVFATGALLLTTCGSALAATDAAQGLQISPVVINLNADKGKTYDLKISVTNVTTGDLLFNSYVNDFKSKDETGNPDILLSSNLPPTASIVSWVQPIGQIPLKSGERSDLDVIVNVPANAESGGHYGIIRFSGTAPQQKQNNVALAASAGVLVLVRVSGQITESLKLSDFYTQHGSTRTSMFATGPIGFVERVTNTGNVHVAPTGNIVITNMLGKNVGTLKVNATRGNVLPSSTRRFEQSLNKKWLFGKYTAAISLAYGTQGKVLLGTTTFWVIPWVQLLIGLAILIVFVLLLRWIIKRYNKWVVKKATPSSHHQPPTNKRPPKPPETPAPTQRPRG